MKTWLPLTFVLAIIVTLQPARSWAAGQSTADLCADRAETQESTFGDLVADALCDKSGATVALVAAISFRRGTIPAGPVTQASVASLLQTPDETWAVSELTGLQIRRALERSVSRSPLPNGAFLQISGLSLTYSATAAPRGRVRTVLAGSQPLNETRKYEVAMPLSLAKGGSGYFQIFSDAAIRLRGADAIARVVSDYVAHRGTVSYSGTGRVRQE